MRNPAAPLGILLALCLLVPTAAAHERYFSPDDRFLIVLGEQNEPVYTYDFTNLDLSVRDNETGDPITGVEETLEAVLIAPDSSELSLPLAVQHGQEGRYEFVEEYQLTMPGQYKVRLTGDIDGTDVSGTYLLPGPRGDFRDITFPHDDVPDLRELQQRIDALESQVAALTASNQNGAVQTSGDNGAPGPGALALLGALGAALVVARRR